MMRFMKLSLIALLTVDLSGCASRVNLVSADPSQVTLRYKIHEKDEADEHAQKYCREFHKRAQFRSSEAETAGTLIGIYDCV